VNLDFLRVGAAGSDADGVVARSPMEGAARAAGARFEVRDGWNVAVDYPSRNVTGEVTWADVSHLPKLELQGVAETVTSLPFGTAVRRDDAWWCRLTDARALVIGARPAIADGDLDVTDVSSNFAALIITGALSRETFARFCALDLRPHVTPVGALRPGSIGRQPGILIREAEDRYLFLFGWATGEYMWSTVADAAEHLGGGPVGVDALGDLPSSADTEAARA
jgi:heterotetrameric sarcosine oxidase gamma subunit